MQLPRNEGKVYFEKQLKSVKNMKTLPASGGVGFPSGSFWPSGFPSGPVGVTTLPSSPFSGFPSGPFGTTGGPAGMPGIPGTAGGETSIKRII